MRLPFHVLDVFTDAPFTGNPLAVVLDAEGLDAARMQAVAREFNLSETVFVLPPRDPVNSARIRIFTPARELPFAGHPTVGAAALLAELRAPEIVARQDLSVVIEEQVGLVPCIVRRRRGVTHASFSLPRLPAVGGEPPDGAAIAAALGLRLDEIGFATHAGPMLADAGVPFLCVPVSGLDAAARAAPDMARWAATVGDRGLYLYTGETRNADATIHARMFAPTMGLAEDPATGSAAAALAGVLASAEVLAEGDHTVLIEQGLEMGRPSLITLGLEIAEGHLAAASIGGDAVRISEGHIAC